MTARCPWCGTDPTYVDYHDNEWGVPLHDDQRLFEALILDGAQAGLSWITILRKRPAYRAAYDDFDPAAVAAFGTRKITALMQNPGLVRNHAKIVSSVSNAKATLAIQRDHGSLDKFLWSFVGGQIQHNHWRSLSQIPATSEASQQMSQALKKLGFNFVGPTICYAMMQAVGMVNDHLISCPRWSDLGGRPTT